MLSPTKAYMLGVRLLLGKGCRIRPKHTAYYTVRAALCLTVLGCIYGLLPLERPDTSKLLQEGGGNPQVTVVPWSLDTAAAGCRAVQQQVQSKHSDSGVLFVAGGANSWEAIAKSSAAALATMADLRGTILVSPSKVFTLFNNSTALTEAIANEHLHGRAPNRLLGNRTYWEFAQRAAGLLPPLYSSPEFYYFQANVPAALGLEVSLAAPPVTCFTNAKCGGLGALHSTDTPCMDSFELTQARLRVVAAGSQHALHYDSSDTIMAQLRGIKHVTLVSSAQLAYLYPYPKGHLLFRRARVSLDRPDYMRFPMSRYLRTVDFELHPGDILIFPRNTAHTTKAVTDTVSLSFRFAPVQEKQLM